jgi:autotransporter-associated beta strand protein
MNSRTSSVPSIFRRLLFCSTLLTPALGWTADWNTTTGLFGTGSNWTPSGVPSGVDANIINGGTAQVQVGDSFTPATLRIGNSSGSGSLTQSGGSIVANWLQLGDTGGIGTLDMSGGTLDAVGGQEMWIGNDGGTGIMNLSGNAAVTNNQWIILARLGASTLGQVTLNGTSSLSKIGGANNQHIGIGLISNNDNSLTLNDSSSVFSNTDMWIGWAGKGTVTLNNSSSMTIGVNLVIGKEKGNGVLSASGDSVANVGGSILVGADNGAGSGTPLGTMIVSDNAHVTAGKIVHVGFGGMSGVLTMNGGTVTANPFPDYVGGKNASVTLGYNGGISAALNLNGGTLETTGFLKGGGTASIKLNGTVIKAIGVPNGGDTFFDGVASSDIEVQAGGAKFDTNGNDITISQDLAGAGSFLKQGAGTLVLSGHTNYLGDTQVDGGVLSLSFASINDAADILINGTGILNLSFNGTDTIGGLFFNGMQQAAGTWGSLTSAADNKSALFTGDGVLVVSSVPEPGTIGLLIASGLALAFIRRKSLRR